jgi:hypothetical protein
MVAHRCGLLDYLEWLRWPVGFSCPDCGQRGGWRLGDGRFMCAGSSGRTSVTAGTLSNRTRTPLTVWFNVSWLLATSKDPVSALSLQRTLEIGSYQSVWACCTACVGPRAPEARARLAAGGDCPCYEKIITVEGLQNS